MTALSAISTATDMCGIINIAQNLNTFRDYFLNGIAISHHTECFDSGVTIKSFTCLDKERAPLFRGFLTRNLTTMRQAFVTDIRPIL